jgi:hypothetical protein
VPRLSSFAISSLVSFTVEMKLDIVSVADSEVTMDVRDFDVGPDSGLSAAGAVSGFEFGTPPNASSGTLMSWRWDHCRQLHLGWFNILRN